MNASKNQNKLINDLVNEGFKLKHFCNLGLAKFKKNNLTIILKTK